MKKRRSKPILKNNWKSSLLTQVILAHGTLIFSHIVYSQDEKIEEEVIVTGSRISRPGLDSISPILNLDSETLEFSSEGNIADTLNKIPALGLAGSSSTNSNFSPRQSGASTINLRNLGSQRTLVLVNGRRHVGGVPGSTAVDINNIPSDFVERVEIVTGGASAVYGSEAVAGVVNIILKDNFEGAVANAQYGTSQEGDGETRSGNFTIGSSILEDRGNFMLHMNVDDQRPILTRDRSRGELDLFQNGEGEIFQPSFSSFIPGGRFYVPSQDTNYTWANETAGPINSANELNSTSDLSEVVAYNGDEQGFNRNFFRTIKVPSTRRQVSTVLNLDLTEKIEFYTEASFTQTESTASLEPEFLGSFKTVSAAPGAPGTFVPVITQDPFINVDPQINPLIPDSLLSQIDCRLIQSVDPDAPCNPNVDSDIAADADASLNYRRRAVEWGNRSAESTRRTLRMLAGFKGEILDTGWNWDVYYQRGTSSDARVNSGYIDLQRFQQGLNVIEVDGEIVCADPTARAVGCVPVNIFGRNNVSDAAVAWSGYNQLFTDELTQDVLSAYFAGDITELPAGPLGFAGGYEYREESSSHRVDPVTADGRGSDGLDTDVTGSYDVDEFFAEIRIPLIANSGIDYLGIEAAVRVADYSTVGSVTNSKFGIEFKPTSQVLIRSTIAEASRAPNITELFTPDTQTFPGTTDPCSAENIDANPTRAANCANLVPDGYVQDNADLESIIGFSSGNPDLQEETAETLTLGVVYTPTSELTVTLDYYNIEVEDVIDTFGAQLVADQCVDQSSLNNPFCDLIVRDENGVIRQINATQVNAASQTSEGWDLGIDWGRDYSWGRYQLNSIINYAQTEEFVPFEGAEAESTIGIIQDQGLPEIRANFRNTFFFGKSSVSALVRYIDEMELSEEATINSPIDSMFYIDSQYRYNFTDKFTAYVGIDNLLDEDPPVIGASFNGDLFGAETQPELYDPIGRFFYFGIRAAL